MHQSVHRRGSCCPGTIWTIHCLPMHMPTDPHVLETVASYQVRAVYSRSSESSRARAAMQVERLLSRIPRHHGEVLRLIDLGGLSQHAVATLTGRAQPNIWYRVHQARAACRWVVETLPDLTPDEVYQILRLRRMDVRYARTIAIYWSEWACYGDHGYPLGRSMTYSIVRSFSEREPDRDGVVQGVRDILARRGKSLPLPRPPRRP